MRTKILIFLICLSCSTKKSEKGAFRDHEIPPNSEINTTIFPEDSILPATFIQTSFPHWYNYNKLNNPKMAIDSFFIDKEEALNKVSTKYDYSTEFYEAYKSVLSFSPDSSMMIDLFSNQVDLKKMSSGKYGGLFTVDSSPFIWELSNKRKYHLETQHGLDSFHDSFWLTESKLALIGTTKIDKPNDYSRVYKIWFLDFEQQLVTTYINTKSCENYHVDDFVWQIKLVEYETYLDEM